jgi:hypothetical protein
MGRSVFPCPGCAYDLSGTPFSEDSILCPECGRTFPRSAIRPVEIPRFTRPLLLTISGPVAALVAIGLGVQQFVISRGSGDALAYGIFYVFATLWGLGAPWIVVSARVRAYRYTKWVAFDELLGAYGLNLVAAIVVVLVDGLLLNR